MGSEFWCKSCKYVLVIPREKLKESGLRVGEDLDIKSEKDKITLTRA